MPVQEIRESIVAMPEDERFTLDSNGFGIFQKVINLKPGIIHKFEHCDFFVDSYPSGDDLYTVEFYITPQPIIYTDLPASLGMGKIGMLASNDNVFYKAIVTPSSVTSLGYTIEQEFPNNFLAASPTFLFFNSKLYMTVIINGSGGGVFGNFACSFYTALAHYSTDSIEQGIGAIRERSNAMIAALERQGRTIPPARNAGQIYPFWRYGGARPERMIDGVDLTNFWLNMSSDSDEPMGDPDFLRTIVAESRKMQSNPTAFGTRNTPDWIRFELNEGIVAGPIRSQWPPIKHADNGNVLCL